MRQMHHFSIATSTLVLFASLSVGAQDYRPLPEQNSIWVETQYEFVADPGCSTRPRVCHNYIRYRSDTLVDGISYRSLWRYQQCADIPGGFECNYIDYFDVPSHLFAFLRQDIGNRKVYVRYPDELTEELLYDFDIGLGPYPAESIFGDIEVVEIDSVLLADGYHKRFIFDIESEFIYDEELFPVTLIEGVGSNLGLFHLLSGGPLLTKLMCFGAEDIIMIDEVPPDPPGGEWVFGNSANCQFDVSIPSSVAIQDLNIHPNPVNDALYLNWNSPVRTAAHLLNSTGAVVRRITLDPGRNVIGMSGLPSGLYLLEVLQGGTFRVVKQ